MLGLRPSQLYGYTKGDILKIYHLIIAYNDKTEEIEYIQEEIEEDGGTSEDIPWTIVEYDEDYFDDEELMKLIHAVGIAKA